MKTAIIFLSIALVAFILLLISAEIALRQEIEKWAKAVAENSKLKEQLKKYEQEERVIKVEKVIMQPKEIECKFMLHERFVDDTELFKKVITSEVARYMAEKINKDPYLCKIYHERNIPGQESIKVRFRLLPYPEGVVWDDIFKEEK